MPAYLAEVLGVLEECNLKLEAIRNLQPKVSEMTVNVQTFEPSNEPASPLLPQYDNSGTPMIVRVHVFDTIEEVRQSHFAYMMEKTPELSGSILAWSIMGFSEEGVPLCEIITVRPKVYADAIWLFWGHELGHCVYGQWHKADPIE